MLRARWWLAGSSTATGEQRQLQGLVRLGRLRVGKRRQALAAGVNCQGDLLCVCCCVCCPRPCGCPCPCHLHCSVNDWTLGLLYRVHSSSSIWLQAAGMYKVEVPGVENINLSRLVAAHGDYLTSMEDVLEAINMHDT